MDTFFFQAEMDPLSFLLRLSLATLLGGLVGFERGMHNQAMGIRTHILISLSSCLLMGLGIFMARHDQTDATRIAAQVVSGIGFLGAGAIMHFGLDVKGLTTAASIWATAALGLAVGAGLYIPSVLVTIVMLLALRYLAPLSHRMTRREVQGLVMVSGLNLHKEIPGLIRLIEGFGIKVETPAVDVNFQSGQSTLRMHVQIPHDLDLGRVLEALSAQKGVEKAGLEQLQ